eukprot:COSAG02_NODE_59912_length_273_cov_0.517241_2_plen_55_part_01
MSELELWVGVFVGGCVRPCFFVFVCVCLCLSASLCVSLCPRYTTGKGKHCLLPLG